MLLEDNLRPRPRPSHTELFLPAKLIKRQIYSCTELTMPKNKSTVTEHKMFLFCESTCLGINDLP